MKAINQKSKLIKDVIEELQDIIYTDNSSDPVHNRILEDLISRWMRMLKEAEEIIKITDGFSTCKTEAERLDFFLKKIYKPEPFYEDII